MWRRAGWAERPGADFINITNPEKHRTESGIFEKRGRAHGSESTKLKIEYWQLTICGIASLYLFINKIGRIPSIVNLQSKIFNRSQQRNYTV